MLTNQTIDPNSPGRPKPFLLLRPFVAVWHWLVPPTQAHKDRQSTVARWVAVGAVTALSLTLVIVGFVYAKPIQDRYQDWKAERLVGESRQMAEDGQMVNAVFKAQEAVSIAPDNINAIRLNTEYLTAMKRPEALYFLDKLDKKGATTLQDRQTRVRALLHLNRGKEASDLLENLLDSAPSDALSMKLAEEVWGDSRQNSQLLRALKAFAVKHPEDQAHSLRLARIQADSGDAAEMADGLRRAWAIAGNDDDLGLQALEFLDGFASLPADEAAQLVRRLRAHPKAGGWHLVAALKRELQLNPARRVELIQEAIQSAQGRKREELVPLVRWLIEQKEPLQVLALVPEAEAKVYQPLLENYLTALTLLQRFDDLERLVSDPKVNSLLNRSISAFYRAHLAFVMRKPADEVRLVLGQARAAAEIERRGELLMKIAEYAEARGHLDIAQDCFRSTTQIAKTERLGYQGLLRTAEANGNTELMLETAIEAVRRWPDDPVYVERFLYVNLLTGRQIELSLAEALKLLEQRPGDHARRLMAALAHWRLLDARAATAFLQNMDLRHLSPGQQAVFAAIARDSGVDNAEDAARTVIRGIPAQARMLPEERALLARAGR